MIDNLRRPLTKKEEAEYTEKDEYYSTLGPYKTCTLDIGGYGGYEVNTFGGSIVSYDFELFSGVCCCIILFK